MEVGQTTANALYQQAVGGTFRMEADAARKCAEVYTRFVETTIDTQLRAAGDLQRLEGFGGFESAQQLQSGFAAKALKMTEALIAMKEAALRMAAAYLRAGQLIEEADAMNARAINTAATEVSQS
ncbi:hypothetical protein IU433_03450 [Nocardia puris]|uniref:Excreted virulence factor EspC (Type VII ESX diderm) n=1 Tax=Nocardia puris TaxID=208602 RepID=A0A366DW03_9NOCA|nr:hypothetical protein [Nocardia puris]MBF6209991.1 hypothetical protein [Nocardia puris]MBF6368182.1 hypothetical protein [Nocardia puris]MBF6458099.1 hypothetical protein [Nocardia puris]RBO94263.1 hypothetical protein DFR74_102686 [Nocardia puris]